MPDVRVFKLAEHAERRSENKESRKKPTRRLLKLNTSMTKGKTP
jgi:hypothetical protein